jgi:hypothetical protein
MYIYYEYEFRISCTVSLMLFLRITYAMYVYEL